MPKDDPRPIQGLSGVEAGEILGVAQLTVSQFVANASRPAKVLDNLGGSCLSLGPLRTVRGAFPPLRVPRRRPVPGTRVCPRLGAR